MKTYWKWILGILIVLAVILAIPFGMRYLMVNGYVTAPGMYAWHHSQMGPAFDMPYGVGGWDGPRGFDGRPGWNHHSRGFGYFSPFMFLGGLLKLAVFFGLLYGAYWLGRRNARIALDPAPAAPAPAPKSGGKAAKRG